MAVLVFMLLVFTLADFIPCAQAQQAGQLTKYNIDLVTGPILSSQRVVSMGGAYTALAHGVDGFAFNPAAYATRTLWEPHFFQWDATATILMPGTFSKNDFFNNELNTGFGVDDFTFVNTGLKLQFGRLGVGGSLEWQIYTVLGKEGQPIDVWVNTYHFGAAWMFWDGQIIVGLGGRGGTMNMDATQRDATVSFNGLGAEIGASYHPSDKQFRIGMTIRSPVKSNPLSDVEDVDETEGYVLPGYMYMPWEFQLGVAWQFGPRPLNRKYKEPKDPQGEIIRAMELARCTRAFEQYKFEQQEHERRVPTVSHCPNRTYRPKDRGWWRKERKRRVKEQEETRDAIKIEREKLHKRLADTYDSLPRYYWLVTVDLLVTGPTHNGIGLDSFLRQAPQRSGVNATMGVRGGMEVEPWTGRLKLRVGGYLEPARYEHASWRMHGTAGFDVRLFTWDFFGWFNPFSIRVGAMVDVAPRYFNWGVGVGFWH